MQILLDRLALGKYTIDNINEYLKERHRLEFIDE